MAMTAREAAWTALQRWRKNGAWSDAALHAVLQNAQLEPRDAALAARICYGTLQNLTLLDHYLSVYCTTPLQKLEPKVLDLLRLSAYQIVLLDKIPPRAAVNEAACIRSCQRGAAPCGGAPGRAAGDSGRGHGGLSCRALQPPAVAGTAVYRRAWLCVCRAGAGGEQRRRSGLPAGEHPENDSGCSHGVPARGRHRGRAAPVASGRAAVPWRQSGGRARLC